MPLMRWILLWLVCGTAFAETPSYITFPSHVDWVTQETPHFHILFRQGEHRLAQRTLAAAERAYGLLSPIFQETPPKTWIILADFHDSLNGYAIDYPFPHFVVFAAPPEPSGALASLDTWLDSVVLHEYVHVLHLYPAHGFWSAVKSVFGTWVLPNGMLPSHLHEGLATFFETHFTRGGRGKGNLFSMFTRMAVKEGVWGKDFVPLDLLEGSVRWPQGASPYYFGYQIYQELWSLKQAEGIHAFVQDTSGRLLPYWLSKSTQEVFGADYPSLWNSVFEKTERRMSAEIAEIESRPLSPLKYLTDTHFYKWDLVLSPDGGKIAYRKAHPDTGNTLEIAATDGTDQKQSIELEAGRQEGLCWVARGQDTFLILAESEFDYNHQLNVLRVINPSNKEKITPHSKDRRIEHVQSIGCTPDGQILTYQEHAGRGLVTAWETSAEWKQWKSTREWPVPESDWVTSLLPGNPSLLALRRGVSTELYEWEANGSPKKIWQLPGLFYHLMPRLPSGEIPAVGTLSGRDEVWALDPKKKAARKLISVLGGVNAFEHQGDKWWVSSYRHGGYDIAETKAISDKPQPLTVPAPESRDLPSRDEPLVEKAYSPISTLLPKAWIPNLLIVPAGVQFSVWVPGFDVSQKNFYNLIGGYDTRGSAFFVGDYSHRFGKSQQFNIEGNLLPSYLIASKAFFRTWGGSASYSTRLGEKMPLFSAGVSFKQVEDSALGPGLRSVGLTVSLSDSFWVRTAPRAIAPLRATRVSISHGQYFKMLGSDDNYFATTIGVDQYLKAPWADRHIFKLAGRFGISQGTAYYNSFFQGGGELQFSPGRGFFLNRGFYPGTFLSQKMLAFNFDYLFPLVEIERGHGQWPFFLKRIDGALVADVLTQNAFMYYYCSAGAELKTHWKTFFYFPTVIRFGAYHGFGQAGESLYLMSAVEATL
jgi:hypothetical protein